MNITHLDNEAVIFIADGFAIDYDGSIESLMPGICSFTADRNSIEITVGTMAMHDFARRVIEKLNISYIYKIFAHYDRGEQSIYIESVMPIEDIRDVLRYACLKGEQILSQELGMEAISPNNFTIAAILTAHYGCAPSLQDGKAVELEMLSIMEGAGHFVGADERYSRWITNVDSIKETLRLFLPSTDGLKSNSSHYNI